MNVLQGCVLFFLGLVLCGAKPQDLGCGNRRYYNWAANTCPPILDR